MRATDVVRSVLDLLDQIDSNSVNVDVELNGEELSNEPGEQTNRFRQVLAMLDDDSFGTYANEPNEVVSDVDSVTVDAGGGVNGSKHSDDIRVKDPRGYE
jgi:hypothetical protein